MGFLFASWNFRVISLLSIKWLLQEPNSATKKKRPNVDHHIFQVLVAILPKRDIFGFDVQSKTWNQLSSVQKLAEAGEWYCAEVIGNYLYVAAKINNEHVICCYDIVRDIWSTLPPIPGSSCIQIGSLCHIEDDLHVIYKFSAPYRYNIATNQWQYVASSNVSRDNLNQKTFCNKAATVYKSCLYALYAQRTFQPYNARLYCFDPKKNVWEQKASTKTPHFGSSLLVVNNNLYVAGGNCSFHGSSGEPYGRSAAIEVYDDQENACSVVQQTHIPPNNLGAVEIDGRVYFIINSFPVDNGIIIPPGEVYPVVLDGWENLGKVDKNAVLCYVPVKTENLKTENE